MLELALYNFSVRMSKSSTENAPVRTPELCAQTFDNFFRLENLTTSGSPIEIAFPLMYHPLITYDEEAALGKYNPTPAAGTVGTPSTPTYADNVQQRNTGGSGTGIVKQSTFVSSPATGGLTASTPSPTVLSGSTRTTLGMGVCWVQLGYVLDLNLTGQAGATPEPCKAGASGYCAGRFHPTKQSGAMGPVKGEVSADELCAYVNAKYAPRAPHHPTVVSVEAAIKQLF
jgi:hypothetical protein